MDLEKRLSKREHKWLWDEIAEEALKNPELVKELITISMKNDRIPQINAAQSINRICDKDKSLVAPFALTLFHHLNTHPDDHIKRYIFRTFQFIDIPEEIEGALFETCLTAIQSAQESIAVKAFALTAARRICEKYPELAPEVIHLAEIILEEKLSAGMINRAGLELKKLRKLIQ